MHFYENRSQIRALAAGRGQRIVAAGQHHHRPASFTANAREQALAVERSPAYTGGPSRSEG
jgi:hypothetical protein